MYSVSGTKMDTSALFGTGKTKGIFRKGGSFTVSKDENFTNISVSRKSILPTTQLPNDSSIAATGQNEDPVPLQTTPVGLNPGDFWRYGTDLKVRTNWEYAGDFVGDYHDTEVPDLLVQLLTFIPYPSPIVGSIDETGVSIINQEGPPVPFAAPAWPTGNSNYIDLNSPFGRFGTIKSCGNYDIYNPPGGGIGIFSELPTLISKKAEPAGLTPTYITYQSYHRRPPFYPKEWEYPEAKPGLSYKPHLMLVKGDKIMESTASNVPGYAYVPVKATVLPTVGAEVSESDVTIITPWGDSWSSTDWRGDLLITYNSDGVINPITWEVPVNSDNYNDNEWTIANVIPSTEWVTITKASGTTQPYGDPSALVKIGDKIIQKSGDDDVEEFAIIFIKSINSINGYEYKLDNPITITDDSTSVLLFINYELDTETKTITLIGVDDTALPTTYKRIPFNAYGRMDDGLVDQKISLETVLIDSILPTSKGKVGIVDETVAKICIDTGSAMKCTEGALSIPINRKFTPSVARIQIYVKDNNQRRLGIKTGKHNPSIGNFIQGIQQPTGVAEIENIENIATIEVQFGSGIGGNLLCMAAMAAIKAFVGEISCDDQNTMAEMYINKTIDEDGNRDEKAGLLDFVQCLVSAIPDLGNFDILIAPGASSIPTIPCYQPTVVSLIQNEIHTSILNNIVRAEEPGVFAFKNDQNHYQLFLPNQIKENNPTAPSQNYTCSNVPESVVGADVLVQVNSQGALINGQNVSLVGSGVKINNFYNFLSWDQTGTVEYPRWDRGETWNGAVSVGVQGTAQPAPGLFIPGSCDVWTPIPIIAPSPTPTGDINVPNAIKNKPNWWDVEKFGPWYWTGADTFPWDDLDPQVILDPQFQNYTDGEDKDNDITSQLYLAKLDPSVQPRYTSQGCALIIQEKTTSNAGVVTAISYTLLNVIGSIDAAGYEEYSPWAIYTDTGLPDDNDLATRENVAWTGYADSDEVSRPINCIFPFSLIPVADYYTGTPAGKTKTITSCVISSVTCSPFSATVIAANTDGGARGGPSVTKNTDSTGNYTSHVKEGGGWRYYGVTDSVLLSPLVITQGGLVPLSILSENASFATLWEPRK